MRTLLGCIIVVFTVLASACVEDDGTEIRTNKQQVINAIGHRWQISEVVYSLEGYEDSVVYNVGEIYYDPCQLPRTGVWECSGYYQQTGCAKVEFQYSVEQTSDRYFHHPHRYEAGCFEMPGHAEVEKLTGDSLVLNSFLNLDRFRDLLQITVDMSITLTKDSD